MKTFQTTLLEFAQIVLPLGIQGENLARRISVQVPDLGGDYWALNVQNAQGIVYPAAVREENGCVLWEVTAGDTAVAGAGKAELTLYGKNGEIIKSATAKTLVHASLPAPTGDAPDPIQSWLDAAYEALNALQGSTVLPPITTEDNGKVLTAQDGAWVPKAPTGGDGTGAGLPLVTGADEGKVLTVVGGEWTAKELPKYSGVYSITPSTVGDQTLETAQKYMDANLTVQKIPYYETSNQSDGETVYIGSEVEIYGD